MSTPIDEGMSTNETGDETHSLIGHEQWDINSATRGSLSTNYPRYVRGACWQIKAATDLLTKQSKRLRDLIKELQQVPPKRNEETTGLIQGPSRAQCKRFDNN